MLVNLQRYAISLYTENNELAVLPRTDNPPKISETFIRVSVDTGIPVFRAEQPALILGMPEPQEGILYIVAPAIASYLAGTRDDIVTPFNAVRNPSGQITAFRGIRLR